MSHIFEALRKSDGLRGDGGFLSPETFFQTLESAPDLEHLPSENAEISPETRLIVWDNPQTLGADRYRLVRMHLARLHGAGRLRALLVTSPLPEDGKSTVALNLATVLADRGKHKVLLLEGDLRRPSLSRRLGLKPWTGLSDCLMQDADPISALRRIEPLGFYLLPAGKPVANPTEFLQSEQLAQIFRALSSRFDWILIDSTPTTPITDTLVLKPYADACLLVARSGKTQREEVEEAIRQFGPGFVIGMIVNGLEGLNREYSDYYTKYYSEAGAKA